MIMVVSHAFTALLSCVGDKFVKCLWLYTQLSCLRNIVEQVGTCRAFCKWYTQVVLIYREMQRETMRKEMIKLQLDRGRIDSQNVPPILSSSSTRSILDYKEVWSFNVKRY